MGLALAILTSHVEFYRILFLAPPLLNCFYDLPNTSSLLSPYSFSDDTNIYFEADSVDMLQREVNNELNKFKMARCKKVVTKR